MRGPKIGIIVQARVGSTRLPRKVLKPVFQSKSILDIILERFSTVSYPLVLATSVAPADDDIVAVAEKHGVDCFRGSEQNVLKRFVDTTNRYGFDFVIRVCADNPFLSLGLFDQLMDEAEARAFDFDYLSFAYLSKPTILTHFGFFTELVRVEALRKALVQTSEAIFQEHVTNYIYKHPDKFRVERIELAADFVVDPNIRMTVDTAQDFDLASALYQKLMDTYGNIELDAINDYLAKHPQVLIKMKQQIQLNEK